MGQIFRAGKKSQKWPALLQRARLHPYVMLSGFSPLVARAQLTRDGAIVRLHESATEEETTRLLQIVSRYALR